MVVSMTVHTHTHARTHSPNAVSDEEITESIKVLQRKLSEVTNQWWQLGLQLNQDPASLDRFKANPGNLTVQGKFEKMLRYWMDEGVPKYRTWGALAKAVDDSGNKAIGRRLRGAEYYKEGSKGNSTFQGVFYNS